MLEIGTSGSVGGEGGNILAYPAKIRCNVLTLANLALMGLILSAFICVHLRLRFLAS